MAEHHILGHEIDEGVVNLEEVIDNVQVIVRCKTSLSGNGNDVLPGIYSMQNTMVGGKNLSVGKKWIS